MSNVLCEPEHLAPTYGDPIKLSHFENFVRFCDIIVKDSVLFNLPLLDKAPFDLAGGCLGGYGN